MWTIEKKSNRYDNIYPFRSKNVKNNIVVEIALAHGRTGRWFSGGRTDDL